MMKIIMAHNILKGFFGICLCLYLILNIGLQKPQNWPKMAISLFQAYFVGHFGYHSNRYK